MTHFPIHGKYASVAYITTIKYMFDKKKRRSDFLMRHRFYVSNNKSKPNAEKIEISVLLHGMKSVCVHK